MSINYETKFAPAVLCAYSVKYDPIINKPMFVIVYEETNSLARVAVIIAMEDAGLTIGLMDIDVTRAPQFDRAIYNGRRPLKGEVFKTEWLDISDKRLTHNTDKYKVKVKCPECRWSGREYMLLAPSPFLFKEGDQVCPVCRVIHSINYFKKRDRNE